MKDQLHQKWLLNTQNLIIKHKTAHEACMQMYSQENNEFNKWMLTEYRFKLSV